MSGHDCELHADGCVFKADRSVLIQHSKVFGQLFRAKATSGDKVQILEICGVRAEIVNAMLDFVYNVEIKDLEDLAWEILLFAAEYEITQLMDLCHSILIPRITFKSLFECFKTLEQHYLPTLEEETLTFALNNISKVTKLPGWRKFICKPSALAMELLDRMVTFYDMFEGKSNLSQFEKNIVKVFECY